MGEENTGLQRGGDFLVCKEDVEVQPGVYSLQLFKLYKLAKPLLKKKEEDEFLKTCKEWNS